MTIKAAGGTPPTNSLSFSEITAEFGAPPGNKLGSYRGTQSINGKGYPLDQGIQEGTSDTDSIKFSDFYSKKLNIVVDCFSGTTETQGNARQNYNSNKVFVVRDFHTKPNVPQNCRIIIKINKSYQTAKHAQRRMCALKSGGFHISNDMVYDIGSNAILLGSGGKGGEGSRGITDGTFQNGGDGASCLGLNHDSTQSSVVVNIDAGALLRCGFGGGGGGGGGQETSKNDRRAGGGGGGGGAGTPFGDGGKGGVPQAGTRDDPDDIGKDGGDGNATTGGSGGGGGDNDDQAGGARGGDGGQNGNPADAGDNGGNTNGGLAGQDGAAIRINTGGTFTLNKSNQATVIGATNATGVL